MCCIESLTKKFCTPVKTSLLPLNDCILTTMLGLYMYGHAFVNITSYYRYLYMLLSTEVFPEAFFF